MTVSSIIHNDILKKMFPTIQTITVKDRKTLNTSQTKKYVYQKHFAPL